MKRILSTALAASVLAAAGGVALAHGAAAADPGSGARIVGGRELASLDENPGATGLHVKTDIPGNGGFICGSMRIGPTWVLTAKHCIEDKYTYTQVSTNTIKRSEGPRPNIVKVIKHPRKIDLALVQIDAAAPGKILTFSNKPAAVGTPLRAYGWGYVDTGSNASTILKVAEGKVARIARNPIKVPIDLTEGMDIVYAPVDGLCWTGDSGGPLTDANGILVGVTSWSTGRGTTRGECGYVSLAHEGTDKWITEHTGIAPGTVFPPAA